MHTDVKLDCDQCSYKHNTKNSLKEHKNHNTVAVSGHPNLTLINCEGRGAEKHTGGGDGESCSKLQAK